jgi:hypothetical protein
MTVTNVSVLVGYRLKFSEAQWKKFVKLIPDELEDSDQESGSGSGSDQESECEDDECDDECDDDCDEYIDNFFIKLIEENPGLEYKTIFCCHKNKGMDRMIDIGYSIGEFSIFGDHKGSHESCEHAMVSMKNAQKASFAKKMKKMFFWKFCINTQGPKLLGQADDCSFCT